jgi:hypothetical protein
MKTLTRKDMYNKYDECILPKWSAKKDRPRSKYSPRVEDKKHRKELL